MQVYAVSGLTRRQQAWQLLALAAAREWGLSPLPGAAWTPEGKPFFPGLAGRCFNLSHSGPLALCALDGQPVGADVQVIKAWRPALPRRVCSPEELAWLGRPGSPGYWPRFTQLWALKECRVKQCGTGLRGAISSVSVPLPSGEETLLSLDGLWFRCYRGAGWRGAVCGLTPPPEELRWLEAAALPAPGDEPQPPASKSML